MKIDCNDHWHIFFLCIHLCLWSCVTTNSNYWCPSSLVYTIHRHSTLFYLFYFKPPTFQSFTSPKIHLPVFFVHHQTILKDFFLILSFMSTTSIYSLNFHVFILNSNLKICPLIHLNIRICTTHLSIMIFSSDLSHLIKIFFWS